jgi:hypothetical protein
LRHSFNIISIHINLWQRIYKCSVSSETYNHFFGLSRIDTHVIIIRPLLNNVSRILDNRYHVLVAYFKYSAVVNIFINRTSKSLIWTKKCFGPDKVPWGAPPLGYPGFDTASPTFTLCSRSSKNAAIHRTRCAGTSIPTILFNSVSWLIRSNALL